MDSGKVASLVYHNDGKEKWQSHEVYLKYPFLYEGFEFSQRGYGATKEEAYDDFLKKFREAETQLEALSKLLNADALDMIEVDCSGEPTFRINGQYYAKALSLDDLRKRVMYGIYIELDKPSHSGDVHAVQLTLIEIINDRFYFRERSEPLLAEEYNKSWRAYITNGRIYK